MEQVIRHMILEGWRKRKVNDNVSYRYMDENTDGNVPIEITEGEYTGLQFRFDGVYFEEKDEELHFNYDYDIINEQEFNESEELNKVLNNILFQVLDEQLSIAGEDGELLKEGDDKKSSTNHFTEPFIQ